MKGERWSDDHKQQLVLLREVRRLTWPVITAMFPGRTLGAVTVAYHNIGVDRRRRELERVAADRAAQARAVAPAKPVGPQKIKPAIAHRLVETAPARAVPPASASVVPTSRLVADAELRDRIAERGLTAGFFGDPAPGRSALDEKRASGAL